MSSPNLTSRHVTKTRRLLCLRSFEAARHGAASPTLILQPVGTLKYWEIDGDLDLLGKFGKTLLGFFRAMVSGTCGKAPEKAG